LIDDGKIIAYKMDGRTMVDADSIEAYRMTLPRIEPGQRQAGTAPLASSHVRFDRRRAAPAGLAKIFLPGR
jgi:hypothetical protein